MNKCRLLFIVLVVLLLSTCLVSCGGISNQGGNDEVTFIITFDTQGGSPISPIKIIDNTTLILPSKQTKEGFTFDDIMEIVPDWED